MIVVTFDVDDVAWTSGAACDEFVHAVPAVLDVLENSPHVKSTWFIRVDAGIEFRRGRADALLTSHADVVERIVSAGHELAWHHHAVAPGTADKPSTDCAGICRELERLAPIVRERSICSVRLGWAQSSTDIVTCLSDLGFAVDSTALPRPSYAWDVVPRDWESTPMQPYRPSRANYRVSGSPAHAILEVPMTVTEISLPTDTIPGVRRYLNVAYHPQHFVNALEQVNELPVVVTVSHPYEFVPQSTKHPLLAFNLDALSANLRALEAMGREFVTMQSLVN